VKDKYIRAAQELCDVEGAYMVILNKNIINTAIEKLRKFLEIITYDDGVMIRGWYRGKYFSLLPEGILIVKHLSGWSELDEVLNNIFGEE